MGEKSKIEWTESTWNPLRAELDGRKGWACVRVSQGCVNCYAATLNRRLGTGLDYTVPALAKARTFLDWPALAIPRSWRRGRRIFVCSMTDLFGEWVPDSDVDRVFDVMEAEGRHTFQVLTKRADRMADYLARRWPTMGVRPPNVWVGVSVEDQAAAWRVNVLQRVNAAVRFLSCEPLIGPLELGGDLVPPEDAAHLEWVIVGGESGPRSRGMDLSWARAIVKDCQLSRTPVFVKQLGTRPFVYQRSGSGMFNHLIELDLADRKGGNPAEWPADLRVREYPE